MNSLTLQSQPTPKCLCIVNMAVINMYVKYISDMAIRVRKMFISKFSPIKFACVRGMRSTNLFCFYLSRDLTWRSQRMGQVLSGQVCISLFVNTWSYFNMLKSFIVNERIKRENSSFVKQDICRVHGLETTFRSLILTPPHIM